jgi:hypothetical protein
MDLGRGVDRAVNLLPWKSTGAGNEANILKLLHNLLSESLCNESSLQQLLAWPGINDFEPWGCPNWLSRISQRRANLSQPLREKTRWRGSTFVPVGNVGFLPYCRHRSPRRYKGTAGKRKVHHGPPLLQVKQTKKIALGSRVASSINPTSKPNPGKLIQMPTMGRWTNTRWSCFNWELHMWWSSSQSIWWAQIASTSPSSRAVTNVIPPKIGIHQIYEWDPSQNQLKNAFNRSVEIRRASVIRAMMVGYTGSNDNILDVRNVVLQKICSKKWILWLAWCILSSFRQNLGRLINNPASRFSGTRKVPILVSTWGLSKQVKLDWNDRSRPSLQGGSLYDKRPWYDGITMEWSW